MAHWQDTHRGTEDEKSRGRRIENELYDAAQAAVTEMNRLILVIDTDILSRLRKALAAFDGSNVQP